jgi:hypothetical protein
MAKMKQTSKKCRDCGRRRQFNFFKANNKTEDGLCHKCVDCAKTRKKTRKKKVVTDDQVNNVLTKVQPAIDSTLMPIVNQVVAVMKATGCGRLTIDLNKGFIEIPTPERFPIPGGKK